MIWVILFWQQKPEASISPPKIPRDPAKFPFRRFKVFAKYLRKINNRAQSENNRTIQPHYLKKIESTLLIARLRLKRINYLIINPIALKCIVET
jgi:hypothetical protein